MVEHLPIAASGPPFASLRPGLPKWVLDHLDALGFSKTTPVQASTVPLLLKHKDFIVEAVTGSGKTLAYLLPMLYMLMGETQESADDDAIKALVLLPTRELAVQVFGVLQSLLDSAPAAMQSTLRPQLVVGGAKTQHHGRTEQKVNEEGEEEDDGVGGTNTPQQDFSRLRKVRSNVIVGTPGRVHRLFDRSIIRAKAKGLQLLVLDEADR